MLRWSLLLLLSGCSLGPPITPDQREYQRVEYIEAYFKPAVANCYQKGGYILYRGPMTTRLRRILDSREWHRLRRSEIISFSCSR